MSGEQIDLEEAISEAVERQRAQSLAVAILDVNLGLETASFDAAGMSAIRWAWEVVRPLAAPAIDRSRAAEAPAGGRSPGERRCESV